ncbi:MAG: phage envelope protein [Flavobacteria bacterium RIFCSPLOWO2_12_FULL_31_7]|nr:MAG: phage envelope protein [Flavobacteria bacterium RIFCSPLOWO2_12_FULL_31_7]
MFTIQQIHEAHSKVKSGADFPKYMQDIIALGVTSFETFVFDNHTDYFGKDNFTVSSEGFSEILNVVNESNIEQFKSDLKSHQLGNTEYMTFLNDCAKSGVEKWIVVMDKMTCSYFDKNGKEMLVEKIPTL